MSVADLDTAIVGFRKGSPAAGDQLAPGNWTDADWRELPAHGRGFKTVRVSDYLGLCK